ncbi:MAG: metallophosphatase [Prevotella sp.]|nr:metallophosphatase [Prevotella sp.]
MKTNWYIYNKVVRTVMMFLPFYLFTFLPLTVGAQKQLVILHTNDTHSTILPINDQLPDTMKAGRAGALRRIAMLKEERRKCPDLLLFDSGDFFQGSAYYTMFKGDVEIGLMNLMGYDAVTIGNHEFDFGLEEMARTFRLAKFPIVCANYDFTGTPCEGLVKPYIILKRQGVKIGVFGLSPKMEGLVSAKNCVGVKYLDPAKVALETATMLKKDLKCDVVICLSHLGWNSNRGEDDQYFVPRSRYIDLVLGGHTHTYFKKLEYLTDMDGKQVPVDQNGKHAIFVGKMVLNLLKK